ncbi:unnamed protein product [Calypogeia fissa]
MASEEEYIRRLRKRFDCNDEGHRPPPATRIQPSMESSGPTNGGNQTQDAGQWERTTWSVFFGGSGSEFDGADRLESRGRRLGPNYWTSIEGEDSANWTPWLNGRRYFRGIRGLFSNVEGSDGGGD